MMRSFTSLAIFLTAAILVAESCDPNARKACPKIHSPVCATFQKTFDNQCELEAALCALAQDGFEFTEEASEGDCCTRACPFNYVATCGSDGNVYPNRCVMTAARCENKDWIEEVPMENCDTPVLS